MAASKIRVLNVQPKLLFSEAIASALASESIEVVYSGADINEALSVAADTGADVALFYQPGAQNEIENVAVPDQIKTLDSKINVIVILEELNRNSVVRAFRAGAAGVLTESSSLAQLVDCINWVAKGNVWASSVELEYLVSALSQAPPHPPTSTAIAVLSPRERQVVDELSAGLTNREIGTRLGLSECTVRNHLYRIFDKIGVYSRVELAVWMAAHVNDDPQPGHDYVADESEPIRPAKPRAYSPTHLAAHKSAILPHLKHGF